MQLFLILESFVVIFITNQELMKKLSLLFTLLLINSLSAQVQLGGDIDGEASYDNTGHSVSLSADGTKLAIGAIGNDGNGNDAGHVRVFEYSNGSWTQIGSDINGEPSYEDLSGWSVSLSGNGDTVAIGAPFNDGNGSNAGHVRIYEYSAGSWTQLGADIDGEAGGDVSGHSVSLSSDGTIVAIGAPNNIGNGTLGNGNNAGHVRIYEYSAGSWTQLGADIDGEDVQNYSGYSVSLSADGSIIAIGAPFNNNNDTINWSPYGHVRVYEYINGSWTQLGADIDGEAPWDQSGYSVSLSSDGTTVAIGAIGNDGNDTLNSNRGHVRVFEYVNGSWTQLGADIDGEAADDQSGYSVSLSSYGTTVAIGAPYNFKGDTNNIDGEYGHVRVYEYVNGSWTQLGSDIDGEDHDEEQTGFSVSISSDGNTVANGAHWGNADWSGSVRVYSIGGNTAGVNSTTLEYQLQIYPNPTKGYLNVEVPQNMIGQSYSIEVKNSIGQSMFGVAMNQPLIQINFNSFGAAGSYILSIKDSGGNVVDTRVIILQ